MSQTSVKSDLTGQRFGYLTVIAPKQSQKAGAWKCLCECGGYKTVYQADLFRGTVTHCGCKASLIGQTFGGLTVEALDGTDSRHNRRWICRCSCGKVSIVPTVELRRGNTRSCGCKQHDLNAVASQTHSRNYPHLNRDDVREYLTMKHSIRKVEQWLTQTK